MCALREGWGDLLLALFGHTPLGFGLAGLLGHYGILVKGNDPLVVLLGWSTTVAMGLYPC